jgi:hypothetical protein
MGVEAPIRPVEWNLRTLTSRSLSRLFKHLMRASVAVTSNLDFAHWTEVFGNERMTAALLDRLAHRSHILVLEGESFRFRQSLEQHQEPRQELPTDAPMEVTP